MLYEVIKSETLTVNSGWALHALPSELFLQAAWRETVKKTHCCSSLFYEAAWGIEDSHL